MAHQFSYTNPETGTTSPEAYGRIDRMNIVDISEVFKTVHIDEVLTTIADPSGALHCVYKVFHDVEEKNNESTPLHTFDIYIGNGFFQRNEELEAEYVENLNAEGRVYLKWGDVFDGVTIDFSDRETLRSSLLSAIYNYINGKLVDGIDLTEAINV